MILLAMALLATGQAPASPAQLEMEAWRAFQAKRVGEIRSFFAPDFVGLYADGTHDLGKELAPLKHVTIRSYRLSSLESHALDANDVLLTYCADVRATVDNRPVSDRLWIASLWRREQGKWLTVYHSEIKAK